MKVGKVNGWDAEEFMKKVDKNYTVNIIGNKDVVLSNSELSNMLNGEKLSISSNGILYRTDKAGLIPSLLNTWFNERVEFRKLAKRYSDDGDLKQYEYFIRRQHIQKIILNSLYGVLGLPVFRFFDIDNAEATTLTGQT